MTRVAEIKKLSFTAEQVVIDWADGRRSRFTSLWLADNDPVHRDAHSGQRLIDVADLPDEPQIGSASALGGALRIEWRGERLRPPLRLTGSACRGTGRSPAHRGR